MEQYSPDMQVAAQFINLMQASLPHPCNRPHYDDPLQIKTPRKTPMHKHAIRVEAAYASPWWGVQKTLMHLGGSCGKQEDFYPKSLQKIGAHAPALQQMMRDTAIQVTNKGAGKFNKKPAEWIDIESSGICMPRDPKSTVLDLGQMNAKQVNSLLQKGVFIRWSAREEEVAAAFRALSATPE